MVQLRKSLWWRLRPIYTFIGCDKASFKIPCCTITTARDYESSVANHKVIKMITTIQIWRWGNLHYLHSFRISTIPCVSAHRHRRSASRSFHISAIHSTASPQNIPVRNGCRRETDSQICSSSFRLQIMLLQPFTHEVGNHVVVLLLEHEVFFISFMLYLMLQRYTIIPELLW